MCFLRCNPFIYCWLNPLFWASAKKCFCCCFSSSKKTTVQKIIITEENGGEIEDIPFYLKLLDYVFCCRQYAPANVHRQYIQHKGGSSPSTSLPMTLLNTKISNMSMMTDTTVMPFTAAEPTSIVTTKLDEQHNSDTNNIASGDVNQLESNEDKKMSNKQMNIVCNTQYDSIECQQSLSHAGHINNANKQSQHESIHTGATNNGNHTLATQSRPAIRLAIYRDGNKSLEAGLLSSTSSECIELQSLTH